MSEPHSDDIDPIVPWLRLSMNTVLPALAVGIAAVFSSGRSKNINFADIITVEDIAEERERERESNANGSDANQTLPDTAPLLHEDLKYDTASARCTKSITYAAIGAFELVGRIVLLVHAVRWHRSASELVISSIVWAYATMTPLLYPPVRPPFTLFILYCLALIQGLLDICITLLSDRIQISTFSVLYLAHLAACFLGALLVLNTSLNPASGKNAPSEDSGLDEKATLGGWLTVNWMEPIMKQARSGGLEDSDIGKLAIYMHARLVTRKFLPLWPNQKILKRIIKANLGDLTLYVITAVINGVFLCIQPILLRRILTSIEGPLLQENNAIQYEANTSDLSLLALAFAPIAEVRRDLRAAYLYTAISFILLILRAHIGVVNQALLRRYVTRARNEVIGSIYAKALVRIDTAGIVDSKGKSSPKDGKANMGKLVSLVNVEANRLQFIPPILNCVTETPIKIAISGAFLYSILGYSAFVGYITFIMVMPVTAWITSKMISQSRVVSKQRDVRSNAINEALQSIKFIKLSAWETHWIARIMEKRRKEPVEVFKFQVIQATFSLIWEIVPIFIACINLAWFTGVQRHQLTVSIAFPAILALSQLTAELNRAPTGLSFYAMVVAAMQRVDEFLEEDEVPAWMSSLKDGERLRGSGESYDQRLGAAQATFRWHSTSQRESDAKAKAKSGDTVEAIALGVPWYKRSPRTWFKKITAPAATTALEVSVAEEEGTFRLRDINIVFPRGKLSVITGATGSGKSSLLAALLGEMDCMSGTVMLPKTNHSVDPETGLIESLSFCSQHPWLESKTIKDNILFGSPFDEQRYNNVLDACALTRDLKQMEDGDATEIGEKGIALSGGQKARVALARAVYARSQTVLLDDVLSAVDTHTAATLIKKCFFGQIMQGRTVVLVTHHFASVASGAGWIVRMDNGSIAAQGTPEELRRNGALAKIAEEEKRPDDQEVAQQDPDEKAEGKADAKVPKQLVEAETKATGAVRSNVYKRYFKASSYWVVALFAASVTLQQLGALAEKLWVKVWTESYGQPDDWHGYLGFRSASYNVYPYLLVYLGLQLATVLMILGTIFPSIWSSLRASRVLFQDMLETIFRSPTRWFDRAPVGRILNRFSKDINGADVSVQNQLRSVAQAAISFLISVAVIAYGVPPFIVPLVLLAWLHLYVARGYITASRDLARLTSTTRSPVITQFGEMLQGLTTIRAFNSEHKFMDSMYKLLDRFHWALYHSTVCDIWLRYRFDVLGAFTFVISALLTIYFEIPAGLAAIVLVQAQRILLDIYFGLMVYVSLESEMNSIERIVEYSNLPSEPPRHLAGVPAAWPFLSEGITFENVVLRYAPDLEPVLRGVSFHVKAGEKIGIVGRTGSGKSTLAMSLFRFVDPDSGKIVVGGRDITTVGVEDLRSHLTLIPQDAVLYSGTIRENLDPFNQHTDAECLEVLKMVRLSSDATNVDFATLSGPSTLVPLGVSTPAQTNFLLDSKVSEGGNNYSAGQRQLIAMARALLRNSGIIVLDESTASVDFETDKKIQNTIREQFKGSILLTIAHRLNTIIDYDRILVLEAGEVVEFDTPAALIVKDGGAFRGMCKESGHFAELQESAKERSLLLV